MTKADEPGKKLWVRDRQQASDQRHGNEYRRDVRRKKTLPAKICGVGRRGSCSERRNASKPESQKNAPSDIKVAEGEYGEAGKGEAGQHDRRDRRPGDPAKNRGGRFHAGRPRRVGHLKAPAEV